MMKSFNLEKIVLEILKENELARSDDMYLYYCYINKINMLPNFVMIFKDKKGRKLFDVATFQAIERAGRKVRKEHPELNPKKKEKLKITENYIDFNFGRNVEIF